MTRIQRLAGIFTAAFLATAVAQDAPRARLVAIGDVDSLLVGHESYCGAMERVAGADLQKISMPSAMPTWVRYVRGGSATGRCTLDFSFTPMPGEAYIARYTSGLASCQVELFRIRPGQDPVRERLTPEKNRSCLLE